ncbi:MAG: hypothetical protein WD830_00385 [Chloroflexota bacterium]
MNARLSRTSGLVVAAVLLFGMPAGILVGLLLSDERLDRLSQTPVPDVQPVSVTEFDERTGVAVTLAWMDGPALYAPSWSGIVGHVQIRPGDIVRSGDVVGVIAGVTRLAVRTPQPFFRPLAEGDRGQDVRWLHDVLIQLGYMDTTPPDAAFVGSSTVSAIARLAQDLGIVGQVAEFDPAWFAWLPEDKFAPSLVTLIAGGLAPSAGTAIATGSPRLQAMSLQRVDGGPLALDPEIDYLLAVAGQDLPLDARTATVDRSSLERLSAVIPPLTDSINGSVRRADPLAVWALPAQAVMSSASGDLCVWVQADGGYASLAVEVISGRAGVTFTLQAAAQADVLQNPAEVLPEPACPSS